ncbi:MAG: hypothetical protein ACRDY6_14505 [Acidimicrobiia bacterium]
MDLNKLTLGDRVVVVSGVLLLIFAFFPWFDYDIRGFEELGSVGSQSGFDFFLFGIIPVILGLAMIAQIAVSRFSTTEMPKVGSLRWGQIHVILGAIAAALVVLLVLLGDEESGFGITVDGDRQVGLFLAALAALGLLGGGLLKMRDPADAGTPGTPPPPVA